MTDAADNCCVEKSSHGSHWGTNDQECWRQTLDTHSPFCTDIHQTSWSRNAEHEVSARFEELYNSFRLKINNTWSRDISTILTQKNILKITSPQPPTANTYLLFCSHNNVISTLSFYPGFQMFGFPWIHSIKKEIDVFRKQGKKAVELSALASDKCYRTNNIVMYLFKAVMRYASLAGVHEICLMINPKHQEFYSEI